MGSRSRDRAIKEVLVKQLRSSGIPIDDVVEWLWDDFGKKVKKDWFRVEKAIVSSREVTPQDLAVFMIDNGIEPEEGAWDVYPARLHAPRDGEKPGEGQ